MAPAVDHGERAASGRGTSQRLSSRLSPTHDCSATPWPQQTNSVLSDERAHATSDLRGQDGLLSPRSGTGDFEWPRSKPAAGRGFIPFTHRVRASCYDSQRVHAQHWVNRRGCALVCVHSDWLCHRCNEPVKSGKSHTTILSLRRLGPLVAALSAGGACHRRFRPNESGARERLKRSEQEADST